MIGIVMSTDHDIDTVLASASLKQVRKRKPISTAINEHREILPLKKEGITLRHRNCDKSSHASNHKS